MARACKRWEEDLALLAGGDLPSVERESEARAHAASCDGCAGLLVALQGDRTSLTAFATALAVAQDASGEAAGLADAVLADLERTGTPPSRVAGGTRGLVARGRSRRPELAAAAAVLVVALAGALATRTLDERAPDALQAQAPVADEVLGGAEAAQERASDSDGPYLPVQVRRSAGNAVELAWEGDERDRRAAGAAYRVLASSSPRDFSAGSARSYDVAGHVLVATAELPAARHQDRALTFFRVQ